MAGGKDGSTAGGALAGVVKTAWSTGAKGEGKDGDEGGVQDATFVTSGKRWKDSVSRLSKVNYLGELSKEASRKEYVRSLIKRANHGTAQRPASKASRMLRFTPSNLYFLLLEKNWWFTCFLTAMGYAVPVCIFALISMPLDLENGTEESELELRGETPAKVLVAFRFASANIIGMGYGTVVPITDVGFFIAVLSQSLGILINVFVFSAVLAKFQSPRADIIFSDKVCFFTRDGVRHLCLRLGNLRCHTLYNPSLRLFVLKEKETSEGESFIQIKELDVEEPGTVSGFYNITHKIDEESPLFELRESQMRSRDQILALQVIFTALDPVYQAEVCAKHIYETSQLAFGKRFADMMHVDTGSGRSNLDFTMFEETRDAPEYFEEEEQIFVLSELQMENDPNPPPKISDKIGLLVGFGRSSYGDPTLDGDLPKAGLRPECAFALSLAMALLESGEEYEAFVTDMGGKASWHAEVNPKLETPSLRLANSEEWNHGTDDIFEMLAKGQLSEFAKRTEPPAGIKPETSHWEFHMVVFAMCMVMGKEDLGMRKFLFAKFGCEEGWPPSRCESHLRGHLGESLSRWEDALTARDYLCGDEPGLLDCRVATKMYLSYQLIECGLANLGAPFKQVAPRSFDYLDRFSKRDSWKHAFGPGRGVGTGRLDVCTIRTVCNKFAMLCPECIETHILPALEKARRKKVVQKKSAKERRNSTFSAALCL